MADNAETLIYRGRVHWAKVLGDPVPNFDKNGMEWTFDFVPDDEKVAMADFKKLGVEDRIRTKKNKKTKEFMYDGKQFISFKQKELKANGDRNEPIRVVDAAGNTWHRDKLIGNETLVDVKFVVVDNGPRKYKGIYPRALRILEHVAFEQTDFDSIDEDDEFYKAAKAAEARALAVDTMAEVFTKEELNDEIGF
jgi:hypothetical protein